jgi:threonine synthase
MLSYGAEVVPVDGTYDQAFELSLEATRQFGWYNRNTAFNPFTIEGKKTSSLEIVEDLGGKAPDVVVVPTGDGVIISGIAKGFRDMLACGAITKLPRLIAVQAEGSSSISRALQAGIDHPIADPNAHTVADSICVSAPRAGILAVREVKRSGGAGVVVTDDSIVEAIGELARYGSVFAEPAASASLAGLHVALEEGLIRKDETVVLMVTGHGLKDIATAQRIARVPEPIAANAQSLKARLGAIALSTN